MENRYAFIGNRFYVLEEMLELDLNIVDIYAIENSYLEKELLKRDIKYCPVKRKQDFLSKLESDKFSHLISNGCPFILPLSPFPSSTTLINIHPSYLPDLRGKDPQPGALLHGKDSGATCHIMDEGIDTGGIIAQIKIPYSQDLNAQLLYQLTFLAEKQVFRKALEQDFSVSKAQVLADDHIYYSKQDSDLLIEFHRSPQEIFQTIKAFSNASQGAYFNLGGNDYTVYDCDIMTNSYLLEHCGSFPENHIALMCENAFLFRRQDTVLMFKNIVGDISSLHVGMSLIAP